MAIHDIDGIQARIRFERRSQGIPEIKASNWQDAFFGLGWLHAHDRGAQLALTRIIAQGRLCELVADNPTFLAVDHYYRRLGLYRDAQESIEQLEPDHKQHVLAFAAGINTRWQRQRSSYLRLIGIQPEPFVAADVLLLIKLMAFSGLAEAQRITELFVMQAVQKGIPDAHLHELLPALNHLDATAIHQISTMPPLFPQARAELGLSLNGGSNAWVVAGNKTASGLPLLANDPHLEINRLPAIFYEAILNINGYQIKGATIPGLPGFVVGRAPTLAWGVTYSCADTSDFFLQHCQSGKYQRDGQWHPFDHSHEIIKRKQQAEVQLDLFTNDQGILETDPQGIVLSWRWTGQGAGGLGAIRAFQDLLHCQTVAQAQQTVQQMDIPTLHMVFADQQGHIGYQHTGAIPKRPNKWSGLAPAIGWDSANNWQGLLDPVRDLPAEQDPASGFLVITNEAKQCPDGSRLATIWLSSYRQQRIEQVLTGSQAISPDHTKQLQYDVISLQAQQFLPAYLPFLPEPQRRLLQQWDGSYHPESKAATLFERIHRQVIYTVFGQQGSQHTWLIDLLDSTNLYPTLSGFFDAVLAKPDSLWLPASQRQTRLNQAILTACQQQTRPWGEENHLLFRNLFLGERLPRFFGFDRGDYPLAGNSATVFQGTSFRFGQRLTSFAPAYHFVTDLSQPSIWSNLPGGASESRFSAWYADDLKAWRKGHYKCL